MTNEGIYEAFHNLISKLEADYRNTDAQVDHELLHNEGFLDKKVRKQEEEADEIMCCGCIPMKSDDRDNSQLGIRNEEEEEEESTDQESVKV